MSIITDLLMITLPAGLVLYGMYLVAHNFLSKQMEQSQLKVQLKNKEQITPVRLSAYERLTLLLERISPSNLILRLNNSAYNAAQFREVLLQSIREEYNHNLSQQLYVSDTGWQLTHQAVEEVIGDINKAAQQVGPEESASALGKRIFEVHISREDDPIALALKTLKAEISTLF